MSLEICSLNSGSNANCYYVGNASEAVLVDAGLSGRETERRMHRAGLQMEKVKAVFISHEHHDHITGMAALSKKFQLPVYITPLTLAHANMTLPPERVHGFTARQPVTIGALRVKAFRKYHDAADAFSFVISGNDVSVGVFTDMGHACPEVVHHFSLCHAVFLEANYCDTLLAEGGYPYYLKKRISGDNGHLSNTQALELFLQHRPPQLQHLILSHLSKNNNHPQRVLDLFAPHAGDVNISVASRYEPGPVILVNSQPQKTPMVLQGAQIPLF
jgi:phosphoribosyl 1,2-cyclic phosphodiesterase